MDEAYLHHMESILRVLVYIEENLSEVLSLDKLAKIARISPYYFHRLFRAYMGETLSEYVTRLRMQQASERLGYTDAAVTEIALDVGYETPSSFTKIFNQFIGASPRAFRQSIQPVLASMIKRVPHDSSEISFAPNYVVRNEEVVLFVRKVGSYDETPWKGFNELLMFLKSERILKDEIKAFYSMGLDDPHFVPVSKCRFDACVTLKKKPIPKGVVGLKTLWGGKCAQFTHKGSYHEIEALFQKIFTTWYPTANVTLADAPPFCEHLQLGDAKVPIHERTTYLYIPIEE